MVSGIALAGLGAAAVQFGITYAVFVRKPMCPIGIGPSSEECDAATTLALSSTFGGLVVLLGGGTMIPLGARQVAARRERASLTPSFRIGPTSASLSWRF